MKGDFSMATASVPRKCFVYSLTSTRGRVYVGASVAPKYRLNNHLKSAAQGRHRSKAFQEEFEEVGAGGFTLSVLEVCDETVRDERETSWIQKLQPELNVARCAVPFQDQALIDRVNAQRLSDPAKVRENGRRASAASTKVVARKILCVETGVVFDSVIAAAAFAGGNRLGEALKHAHKTAYGYHWRYADDNYRPRTGLAGTCKARFTCAETGETFEGLAAVVAWFKKKGVAARPANISQSATKGCRAYGFHFARI